MKNSLIIFYFLIFSTLTAQQYKTIEVGFTNTVHLIFQTTIKDFDVGLGSVGEHNDILVEQAGDKRLKLAAGIKNFTSTNLFVETDDGYYNFILTYNSDPRQLLINIEETDSEILKKTTKKENNTDEKRTEKDSEYRNLVQKCLEKSENTFIYANNSLGIYFTLNAIYVQDDKLLFKFTVKNNSNVKYEVGYLGYVIHKKGRGKRQGVVTDEIMSPVYSFQDFYELQPNESKNVIAVFNKFTLDKKKKFLISLWEKEGERKIDLIAKPVQIVKAKKL